MSPLTFLFALAVVGLVTTIAAFARRVATLEDAITAAYAEAEDARAELAAVKADNAESEHVGTRYWNQALNTLRGQVAEREAFILTLAAEFNAAWQQRDQLAARRSAKKRATKKAAVAK